MNTIQEKIKELQNTAIKEYFFILLEYLSIKEGINNLFNFEDYLKIKEV